MAKIKTTAVVDAISGKLNGTVFSRNRGGAYMRSKGVIKFKAGSELADSVNLGAPTVQSGSPQSAAQAILSGVSSAWRGLTGNERIAFNNAVSDWQRTDVFGDLRSPTGAQLFTRLNATQLNLAQYRSSTASALAPINTPPALRIPLIPVVDAVFRLVMGDSDSPGTDPIMDLFAGLPNGVATLSDDVAMLVEMSRPMSAGISKVSDSDFRQFYVDNVTARSTGPFGVGYSLNDGATTDVQDAYVARFGVDLDVAVNPSLVGSKIFVRITPVSLTQGTKGQAQLFSTLIEAPQP